MIKLTYEINGDQVEATFDTIDDLEKFQESRIAKAKERVKEAAAKAKKEAEERIAKEKAERKEYEERLSTVEKNLRKVFIEAHKCGIAAEDMANMISSTLRELADEWPDEDVEED